MAMECYVNSIATDGGITADVKTLIPDAGLRRRMSRIVKTAVAVAAECAGGIEGADDIDAVITATGWGCLADSERFLRNVIADGEQLLNPTPFIQSTFNTVGGQIALLRGNHCYNVTYVNRSHSFEDALLDAMMRLADGDSRDVLVGAFDEQTPSQHRIMERMGLFRGTPCGEGALFARLSAEPADKSIARLALLDFPSRSLTADECRRYATKDDALFMINDFRKYGLWPTASAMVFAAAVDSVARGAGEVVVYNEYLGGKPAVMVLQCVG